MDADLLGRLAHGLTGLTWQSVVMLAVGALLIYLAVAGKHEPLLLLPIGSGAILANLPHSPLVEPGGLLSGLYEMGVATEWFPLLIFVGIGAMTDFAPLLENPKLMLLGAAGQFGIFATLILALALGFTRPEAASIGVIGAIDGPTSIYVSGLLAPHLLGPISVAAYSYMAAVPILLPPVMRALTTSAQRAIRQPAPSRTISRRARVLFPIVTTVLVGVLVPFATPLIGTLMLGNLLRESGVVDRLVRAATNELTDVVTLLLGLAIGSTMRGEAFLRPATLAILALGLIAFVLDTVAGLALGQLLRLASRNRFNPLIGAAGISAFPMAARVVQREATRADPGNFVLMHAMGANAAGQVASVVAGGTLLAMMLA